MMAVTVGGFVKNGVVVPNAPLPEGAQVEIRLNERAASVPAKGKNELAPLAPDGSISGARLSMLEFLESLPPGPRAFQTWEDYEQHLREEKDAWER